MSKFDMATDFLKASLLGALVGGGVYSLTHDEPGRALPAHGVFLAEMYKWDQVGAGLAGAAFIAGSIRRRKNLDRSPE